MKVNRKEAKRLLNQTFSNEFDENKFTKFTKELFNEVKLERRDCTKYIAKQYKKYISSFQKIGDYTSRNSEEMEILVVKLKRTSSKNRARTMQRNFVAKWLNKTNKESALVAFYDETKDWRLSYVKMEYNLIKDKKGKIKTEKELTPAKRYSFLVGVNEPNHTCREQFLDLIIEEEINPSIKEIKNKFSIDKVTKEFFEKYKKLYNKLKNDLDKIVKAKEEVKREFNDKNISNSEFAKKILSQIVFIYFLQKKGWLGVDVNEKWGEGPKNFLRILFGDQKKEPLVEYDNFFNEILEPLFYEALATNRSADDHYYRLFDCKIPFLNGGLFEPINDYNWSNIDIEIDNSIFKEILDTFDRFNFTVKENEPLEKEVAVDPEMLGKVFENLQEQEERKKNGEFYTPREIVHYMCQQSLTNYLVSNTSVPKNNIKKFVEEGDITVDKSIRFLQEKSRNEDKLKNGEITAEEFEEDTKKGIKELNLPNSIIENREKIQSLLKDIKIVDPAVGSGAFLVGMMNEIIKLRLILSVFDGGKSNEYLLKKDIIEDNLYGVDKEFSAVQICKLRLWLSLIVDENDIENIEPLPNLDHKIMCGNSLLKEFRGNNLFNEDLLGVSKDKTPPKVNRINKKIDKLYSKKGKIAKGKIKDKNIKEIDREIKKLERKKKKFLSNSNDNDQQKTITEAMEERIKKSRKKLSELKKAQKKFFNEQNRVKKRELRERITEIEWELIEETLKDQNNEEAMEKLSEYKNTKSKPFFIWKLYFFEVFQRENPGFDVVIANPPYGIKEKDKIRDKYDLKNNNSYGIFISLGMNRLLREKGVLTYIVSDTWLTIKTHKALRKQVLEKELDKVIRLHRDAFDATVNPCIFILKNINPEKNQILTADLTNISTREEKENFREKIYNIEDYAGESNTRFAVYKYSQSLIEKNTNLPIFVASPKIFKLMNNTSSDVKREKISREDEEIKTREIKINDKKIKLVQLGKIAEVPVGLQTGDNPYYLYQNPKARGTYKNINKYDEFLLKDDELKKIAGNENLRKKVIENGFHKSKDGENFDPDLWFEGRYIVPYDKGGKSDSGEDWLPNYYVPTDYYLDWSQEAVKHLKKKKKIRDSSGEPYPRNKRYYFKKGITFSDTGVYSPTYRLNIGSVFDQKGSCIFTNLNVHIILGLLCSKLTKYLTKNYINHTVSCQSGCQKQIPLLIKQNKTLKEKVISIIEKQRKDQKYDYMSNEQKEIDNIVYDLYGLNKEDIKEVETWYARRYPNLVDNQSDKK